ncbi:hypothetical protein ACHAXT_008372 [Thalassiosira profunda]
MAQHTYHVQKYGIDGPGGVRYELGNGSPGKRGARTQEGDEWDRIMDDAVSNVSFSSTAIGSARKAGYHTPSPDQSSDDDSGDSFFDKSAVEKLATPEKARRQLGEGGEKAGMVTGFRGQACDDSSSSIDNSPERSTNVSGMSAGSGFANMFQAALRFNRDFEEQPSFMKEEASISPEDSQEKSPMVSFAADTSFASKVSPARQRIPQIRSLENNPNGLEGLDVTPTRVQSNGENNTDYLNGLESIASPGHQNNISWSFGDHMNFVEDLAAGNTSTPKVDLAPKCPEKQSASHLQTLGISPICNSAGKGKLKSPTPMPFDEKHITLATPFDESVQLDESQRSVLREKCLFPEEPERSLSIEIADEGIEVVAPKKQHDTCLTATMVTLEESLLDEVPSTSLSEEASPFSYKRTFGSNAAFRINAKAAGGMGSSCNDSDSGNRRGVRLSRLSKMKELGLERALSSTSSQCGDNTF